MQRYKYICIKQKKKRKSKNRLPLLQNLNNQIDIKSHQMQV